PGGGSDRGIPPRPFFRRREVKGILRFSRRRRNTAHPPGPIFLRRVGGPAFAGSENISSVPVSGAGFSGGSFVCASGKDRWDPDEAAVLAGWGKPRAKLDAGGQATGARGKPPSVAPQALTQSLSGKAVGALGSEGGRAPVQGDVPPSSFRLKIGFCSRNRVMIFIHRAKGKEGSHACRIDRWNRDGQEHGFPDATESRRGDRRRRSGGPGGGGAPYAGMASYAGAFWRSNPASRRFPRPEGHSERGFPRCSGPQGFERNFASPDPGENAGKGRNAGKGEAGKNHRV